jgi:hypothetical protein
MAVLTLAAVFSVFALGFDAGLWALDHRTAQNQADAAALAAVQHLPNADTAAATAAVGSWLAKNNSGLADLSPCPLPPPGSVLAGVPSIGVSPVYFDLHPLAAPNGLWDTVRVCVRRQSPAVFSLLSAMPDCDLALPGNQGCVWVSAAATARVGPASTKVMPWGIVPPDPTCVIPGEECQDQFGADCGHFPLPTDPPNDPDQCPWGLDLDRLYPFKVDASGSPTPGNFGGISACGGGASDYRDCVSGAATSTEFFSAGAIVNVETAPGSGGGNTCNALAARYDNEVPPGGQCSGVNPPYPCDVEATPVDPTGLDPDGRDTAAIRFGVWPDPLTGLTQSGCERRLVVLPVIKSFPPAGASAAIEVLGTASFGIAKWDRRGPWGTDKGTAAAACGPAAAGFGCGMVWGYLFADARPPDFLLEGISDTVDPLAPLLEVLIE